MPYSDEQNGAPRPYPNCFGCGDENPFGLRLKMRVVDGELKAIFTPMPHHQGWPGIVHGGVISALLYEVMENWAYLNGIVTMMRSMDVRLISPAEVSKAIHASSWLNDREGRNMTVAARLESGGKTIAEADASLVEIDRRRQRLITED